ncbi:hypothetical protein JVT61DRAFT_13957 [Boletus reticuloceps]|uniref:DUF7904 domain-containing protein n=1 Tax=Boletus reticuloceps TaxID=495285 RepID=A0A8I2YTT2_9AGAM|nr:hypothetical protein JVT61DRAFT_13957 [Boletus reticuloceps]
MSTTSTPHSARFDLPPAPTHSHSTATDTGLAEWTNRIKAMQRQVDADDETEKRRLEEEIMRARLARTRRNKTGQSGDFGVGMHGIDLSTLQDASTMTGAKPTPMSLAAFMGGNATGPRLRRQEPQADASFAYDGRGDHGPIHPIFGRGGIAMPGMVGHEASAASTSPSASTFVPQSPPSQPSPATPQTVSSEPSRARTMSTSNVARRYVEKIEEHASSQSSSSQLPSQVIRERRQSTPHGSFSELKVAPTPSLTSHLLSQNLGGRAVSPAKSPIVELRPKTLSATDIRPKTPMSDFRPRTAPAITETRSKTPSIGFPTKPLADEPRAKTPGTDTTRAKTPIPSSPTRTSFSGALPWQTPRHRPSPSYRQYRLSPRNPLGRRRLLVALNSSVKDPTPSISRLQGRGFVQSMVQASDKISGDTHGSPSAAPKHVFPSTSPAPSQGGSEAREKGTRRGSVLDRWTPVMNANGNSTPPPLPTSKSATPTRPYTAHKSGSGQGQDVSVVKTHDTGRSVRSAVSLPSMPKTPLKKSDGLPMQDVEKLGSSTPEGGVQVGGAGAGTSGGDAHHGAVAGTNAFLGKAKMPRVSASALPSSPGKPLSHPTKDRAKKPRKARFEESSSRPGDVPATSNHPSAICDQLVTGHSPDPALPSSTTRSTSSAPASSGLGGSQTSITGTEEPPAKTSPLSMITDRWTEPTLIGIKSTSSRSSHGVALGVKPGGSAGIVGRRALPGLANAAAAVPGPCVVGDKDEKPREGRTTAVSHSPTRHTRIPTARQDRNARRVLFLRLCLCLRPRLYPRSRTGTEPPRHVPSTGFSSPAAEKRKSSYERYSAITMPPLAEERTPAVTPANTMSRTVGQNVMLGGKVVSESPSPWGSLRAGSSAGAAEQPPSPSVSAQVHIEHVDVSLPKVDVTTLLKVDHPTSGFVPNLDLRTVSVEVLSVVHTSAVPVQRDTNVFYDGEVLVIVHRAKSRETGLVATKVWCWKGNKCHFGDKEEMKVGELARRYGTSADVVEQQREPAELVHILGGQLAIRQGTRAHWSSENTAMHVVRSNDGHVLIDEMDLNIKSLCSGYSYCITTILDNIYVWHGCGSVAAERTAALRYAQDMATKGTLVKELVEGENDGDEEMFWMIVGDSESYAKADYWRWRHSIVPSGPRCWLVDVTDLETPIRPVPTVFAETIQQESVYIIDCFWEFFVLVGRDARAKRSDITLSINTAMAMAPLVAAWRPFSPTIHVLILPTQLPLDMQHAFRNLDELTLNGGFVPDHMNILSTQEAIEHLRTSSWDRSALRDHTMLPLGLDSSHVPLS